MPALAHVTEPDDLVCRLRRVFSSLQLDCQCRATLDGALDRFSALEYKRRLRKRLREARHQRDQVAAQLTLLAELDEITEHEPDQTVFEEMALSFDQIADLAATAAEAMREARALRRAVA